MRPSGACLVSTNSRAWLRGRRRSSGVRSRRTPPDHNPPHNRRADGGGPGLGRGNGPELPQRRREYAADAFKLTRTGEVVLATDDARGSGRGGSVIIDVGGKIERFRYDGDVQRILVSQDGEHIAVASSLGASSSAPVSPGRQLVTVWRLPSPVQVLRFKYTTKERDDSIPQAFFILGNRWYLGVDDGETIDGGGRRSPPYCGT